MYVCMTLMALCKCNHTLWSVISVMYVCVTLTSLYVCISHSVGRVASVSDMYHCHPCIYDTLSVYMTLYLCIWADVHETLMTLYLCTWHSVYVFEPMYMRPCWHSIYAYDTLTIQVRCHQCLTWRGCHRTVHIECESSCSRRYYIYAILQYMSSQ